MKRFGILPSVFALILMGCHGGAMSQQQVNYDVRCLGNEAQGDLRAVTLRVAEQRGLAGTEKDWAWLSKQMQASGADVGPLKMSEMGRASVYAEATLIRKGALVAALMVHDGSRGQADYSSSVAATEIKRFLVNSVAPTSHPDDAGAHGNGDDGAGRILLDIAKRLAGVKVAMGPFYSETAAKYFIRAHAYSDPIGVEASRQLLCSQGLKGEQLRAIGMSAAYVATGKKPQGALK